MKTKILIIMLILSIVLIFGCTTNEDQDIKDDLDSTLIEEIDSTLIDENGIEIGEIIPEENIENEITNEIIQEDEEIEIGEMI
jgi:hypothetical protein